MVPKLIHYCWFGQAEKSKLVKGCMDSWKNNLKDYQVIEWNETNFNIESNDFVKNAYGEKKWAFVADYCRLWALFNHGGIYLDTDVEVLRSFDDLLGSNFLGYEQPRYLSTAVLGFEKNDELIRFIMELYQAGEFDYSIPNSKIFFQILQSKYNIPDLSDGMVQCGAAKIYPVDYFSPKDYVTKKVRITENSYCIHHFDGTWKGRGQRIKSGIQNMLIRLLGNKLYYKIKDKLSRK